MSATRRLRRILSPTVLAWGLSLVCGLLAFSIPEPGYRLEYKRIQNRQGMPLRVVVYSPEPLHYERAPAAVICQPFNNPPEYSRLLALELVEDGFVVLTFDWRGREREENRQLLRSGALTVLRADAAAAVAHLRSLPPVDPEQVMITGHSVGGTLAIEAGTEDPRIAAVASIGMEADVAPDGPRNLLWAQGLYDEFRVLNRMREVFRASAASAAMEETTVGDFARGTARRLSVSPTADHFTELQDSGIHRAVLDWFRQAAGLPAAPRPLRMETRALLFLVAWLAALMAALISLGSAVAASRWPLRLPAALALVGIVLLSQASGRSFLLATDAILWLLLFALLGGFLASREPQSLERGWRWAARAAIVLWASLFLTQIVNNVANYVHEPRYLLSLPEFALRHALDALYAYLMVYSRPLLFSVYDPATITPRIWVYAVPAIELLSPGILLGLIARLARRRPRAAEARPPMPVKSAAALALLLVVLGVVAWLRLKQGFLTGESALAAGRYMMRFTVLPVFLFALLWRLWGRRGRPPQPPPDPNG